MPKRTRTARSHAAETQLAFDAHLLDVYLTGLQAEVEAKLRRVAHFREQTREIDAAGGRTNMTARKRAADALIAQIDDMLQTNVLVRGTLEELRRVAIDVRRDIDNLAGSKSRTRTRSRT